MNTSRKRQLLEANAKEEKGIKRLEKALKLNKRKRKKKNVGNTQKEKKIHHMFEDDGLDYILGVLDQGEKIEKCNRPNKMVSQASTSIDEEDDYDIGDSASDAHDSESEREEEMDEEDLDDEDDGEEDKGLNHSPTPTKKRKLTQDIYGRFKDERGNIVDSANVELGKYIPPAKRLQSESSDENRKAEMVRIRRQLKGLLNRLGESNMQPIFTQIEQLYMKNSRNGMNESLFALITELVVTPILTPPRLMMEQAMMVTMLHATIGSEIGAYFLQNLVMRFHAMHSEGSYEHGKESNNLLLFLSYLYHFKVTHCTLMFDILTKLIDAFKEKDVELIQDILKTVGFNLRKDNPLKLKEIIQLIQKKAPALQTEENSSRIKFMLDTLTAIRNNNMYKIPEYDPSILEHTKKVLRGFLSKGTSAQELVITFDDLLKAQEKGRWWIVGSAWCKRSQAVNEGTSSTPENVLPQTEFSDKILELARKQHMNTDIRRTLFCILMTAEDYMDAFEKLLRLNLKNQQEQEIVHVLLHCSLNEKQFNPYYAFLAGKFCKFARKYQMSFQFAIWDKFKELQKMKPCQAKNLAHLLSHLFVKGELPLSVLKVIHFSEMNKTMVKFFRLILLGVLLDESEEKCYEVFKRIAPAKNLNLLREGLHLFMHHFLLQNTKKLQPDTEEKLRQRIKLASRALNSSKNSFKL